MNKLAKGAIAGAAGIALLLGGAGTFALWNDEATVSGSTVTSGTLAFGDESDGVWTNETTGAASTSIPSISNFLIVPGNTIKYTQNLNVSATGTDLKAKLTIDSSSVTVPDGFDVTFEASGAGVTESTTEPGVYIVTVPSGSTTVSAVVTVEFDAEGTDDQDVELDLSGIEFTLQQIAI